MSQTQIGKSAREVNLDFYETGCQAFGPEDGESRYPRLWMG